MIICGQPTLTAYWSSRHTSPCITSFFEANYCSLPIVFCVTRFLAAHHFLWHTAPQIVLITTTRHSSHDPISGGPPFIYLHCSSWHIVALGRKILTAQHSLSQNAFVAPDSPKRSFLAAQYVWWHLVCARHNSLLRCVLRGNQMFAAHIVLWHTNPQNTPYHATYYYANRTTSWSALILSEHCFLRRTFLLRMPSLVEQPALRHTIHGCTIYFVAHLSSPHAIYRRVEFFERYQCWLKTNTRCISLFYKYHASPHTAPGSKPLHATHHSCHTPCHGARFALPHTIARCS